MNCLWILCTDLPKSCFFNYEVTKERRHELKGLYRLICSISMSSMCISQFSEDILLGYGKWCYYSLVVIKCCVIYSLLWNQIPFLTVYILEFRRTFSDWTFLLFDFSLHIFEEYLMCSGSKGLNSSPPCNLFG